MPKETRNPKPESGAPMEFQNRRFYASLKAFLEKIGSIWHRLSHSDFELRISFGFRLSDLGFIRPPVA